MLDSEDLERVIRQLLGDEDSHTILNIMLYAMDKELLGYERSSSDVYEEIIRVTLYYKENGSLPLEKRKGN